ncbi:MAG: hypothetical protein ACD_50C00361G0001 [uncultured bacterium]|nr:MAG: hypothetical protein ACD_50C00361G0001 [uncultured bacterium]OGH14263.1 MAG: hypothetical protein A2687_01395 [Candidatus Levybacteria bacterium RIFCSPHIGHO2_01_FULL_38_26]
MTIEAKRTPIEIEEALKFSIKEAENFGDQSVIVKTQNKLAHWLMTDRRYEEAIPLFRNIAQFQELHHDDRLAHSFHMLSSCLSHQDDSENLREGIEFAEKAFQLYGDSEEHTESKKSTVALQVSILYNLSQKTKNKDYAEKIKKVYKKHQSLFNGKNDKDFKGVVEELEATQLA